MVSRRDQVIMRIALLGVTGKRVRAVIVNEDGRIISSGNTDRVKGCKYSEELGGKGRKVNWKYSVHAEMKAILSCNPKGCTIYVSAQPCNECAKLIIHSGITRVVYRDGPDGPKEHPKYWGISLDILVDAGVLYDAIEPNNIPTPRNFNEIEADKVVGLIVDSEGNIVGSPQEPEEIQPPPPLPRGNANRDSDLDMIKKAMVIGRQNETRDVEVGALISDSMGNIVSSGYPRKPRGCQQEGYDDSLPCGKIDKYAIHAVADAILGHNVKGCTLYLTKYPCNESARMISEAGISRLVTYEHNASAAKNILKGANVDICIL